MSRNRVAVGNDSRTLTPGSAVLASPARTAQPRALGRNPVGILGLLGESATIAEHSACDGDCEKIRAGIPAAARRANTNLVGFRPKLEPAKVSFVKRQGRRSKNHQPDKRHHQTRMTFQEMAFHEDADSLKEEIDHHCAKENSARDTVKREVYHAFVHEAGSRKDQEQREHGAPA